MRIAVERTIDFVLLDIVYTSFFTDTFPFKVRCSFADFFGYVNYRWVTNNFHAVPFELFSQFPHF